MEEKGSNSQRNILQGPLWGPMGRKGPMDPCGPAGAILGPMGPVQRRHTNQQFGHSGVLFNDETEIRNLGIVASCSQPKHESTIWT